MDIIILTILGFFVAYFLLLILLSEAKFFLVFKRNCLIGRIIQNYVYKHKEIYKIDKNFDKKAKYKTYTIKSFDGLTLTGYFFEKSKKNIAIVVHGYGARAMDMEQYINLFCNLGYSVLAVDNRGHGKSDGRYISFAKYDGQDVLSWTNFLAEKFEDCNIVVFGLSMGGATVCMFSGLKKPSNVKAIISDCGFSNGYQIFKLVSYKLIIPAFGFSTEFFDKYIKKRVGFALSEIDATKQVEKCDVPILFLHGSKDGFVPQAMQLDLYNSAPENLRQMHVFDGAIHAGSLPKYTHEYTKVVTEFLESIKK